MATSIIKDGGYTSRKLWFAIFTSFMIILSSRICQLPSLGEVISGLVAVAGIYITGNVITRWRASAANQVTTPQQPTPEPPKTQEQVKPEDDMRG